MLPFAYFVGAQTVPGFTSLPAGAQSFIAGQVAQNPQVVAAAGVGQRFNLFTINNKGTSEQWSDELQAITIPIR